MHLVLQHYSAVCWMFYYIEYGGVSYPVQLLRQQHTVRDAVDRVTKKVPEDFVSLLLCENPQSSGYLWSYPGCCDALLGWQYWSVPLTPRGGVCLKSQVFVTLCTNKGNIKMEMLHKKHFWARLFFLSTLARAPTRIVFWSYKHCYFPFYCECACSAESSSLYQFPLLFSDSLHLSVM